MNDNALITPRPRILSLYALTGAAAISLAAAGILPGLARGQEGPDPAPMDVMADAVLIDARCRTVPVDMGALLRYGQRHGIPPVEIMPIGVQRKSFEAALARRSEGVSRDLLCTTIAARTQDLAPGVLKAP